MIMKKQFAVLGVLCFLSLMNSCSDDYYEELEEVNSKNKSTSINLQQDLINEADGKSTVVNMDSILIISSFTNDKDSTKHIGNAKKWD